MARRYETVSFLCDYGTADESVGVIHAVLRELAPHARVVDVTHGIEPFDVRAGSLALARSIGYLPTGVVLALVDPGVGTGRRPIAIEVAGGEGILVGPDNGLLAPAVAMAGGAERAVELTESAHRLGAPGSTSDGRDVFAPAVAHLCNGGELTDLGALLDTDLLLPGVVALAQADESRVIAQVLWVDRFGNAQLNVGPDDLPDGFGDRIELQTVSPTDPTGGASRVAERVATYADLAGGAVGLVLDSVGLLAVAMDQRSAADELGLAAGDQVTLLPGGDDEPVTQPVTLRTQR